MDIHPSHKVDPGLTEFDPATRPIPAGLTDLDPEPRPIPWSSPPSGHPDPILWEREIVSPASKRPMSGRGKLVAAVLATSVFVGMGFVIGAPVIALSRLWNNRPVATATLESAPRVAPVIEGAAAPPADEALPSPAPARPIQLDREAVPAAPPQPRDEAAAPDAVPEAATDPEPAEPAPTSAVTSSEPPPIAALRSEDPIAGTPIDALPNVDVPSIDPASIESFTLDPVAVESFTLDPVSVERVTIDPVAIDHVTIDPVTIDRVTVDPVYIDVPMVGNEQSAAP